MVSSLLQFGTTNKKELFIARDHFESNHFIILFKNNNFIFGSRNKSLFLKHPDVSPIIDTLGLCELLGLVLLILLTNTF